MKSAKEGKCSVQQQAVCLQDRFALTAWLYAAGLSCYRPEKVVVKEFLLSFTVPEWPQALTKKQHQERTTGGRSKMILCSTSFKPINLCWSKPVTCTFQITSSHSRKPTKSFVIGSLQRMWYIYVKHKFDSSSGKSEFEPQSLWRFANFSLFLYCCKLNILDKLNNQQLCISLITERHN